MMSVSLALLKERDQLYLRPSHTSLVIRKVNGSIRGCAKRPLLVMCVILLVFHLSILLSAEVGPAVKVNI